MNEDSASWNVVLEDKVLFGLDYEAALDEAFIVSVAYDGWGAATKWTKTGFYERHYYIFEDGKKRIIASIERAK